MFDPEFTHPNSQPAADHRSSRKWNRRHFMARSLSLGAAGALTGATATCLLADAKNPPEQKVANGISELRLFSHKVAALETFYSHDLGLPTQRNGDELIIEAGATRIVFSAAEEGEPFYHFAFNIPENKLNAAVQWQKKRTELVRRNKEDVVHFAKWNADSVFFRDPAGNLLEYIARHDLKNAAEGDFSTKDILYASEIGLVVDDIPETVAAAKTHLDLGIYRDNGKSFASIGDEHALLVVVKRDRKWFPARKRAAKVFPLAASIRGPKPLELEVSEYDYQISIK